MDNKSIFIILGIIILFACLFIFSLTPSIEINDFHGEKTTTIVKYVSGKSEQYLTVSFLFNIVTSKNLDKGIKYSCLGYDKNGKLILNESNECGVLEGEQNFSYSDRDAGMEDISKIKKIELYIYEYGDNFNDPTDHGKILYHGVTEDIQKGKDKVEETDDTIDWSSKSHKSNNARKYPTEDMYNPPEKKNYVVISKPGEPELRLYYNN